MCLVTKQYDLVPVKGVVTPCGWEGNRRSGVALAMHHRLRWFVHLQAHGLRKGDDHPAYTPHGVSHTLPLPEDDIYGAIIMAQSHCKISPDSSDECLVAANLQTKPIDLGCESAENWQLLSTFTIN